MLKNIKATDTVVELAKNDGLARELQGFFANPKNRSLWAIDTGRQKLTKELRYTQHIPLRANRTVPGQILLSTSQWNQVCNIVDHKLLEIPIFKKTNDWVLNTLQEHNSNLVICQGRSFFSKHLANTTIDNHIDEGSYFDHYWYRLHFVVESNLQNWFYINHVKACLEPGKLYWINNHVPHWLENASNSDRINLITDIHCQ
jgi:hypothetical protein